MKNLSLRLRLLVAVGAVSLVALGIADVVVFGSLRTYLYDQVDGTLVASHRAVEMTADNPAAAAQGGSFFVPSGEPLGNVPPGNGGPTPGNLRRISTRGGNGPNDAGSSAFCALGRENAPGMSIEVRNTKGTIVTGAAGKEECPAFQPGNAAYSPSLPATITGFARQSSDPTELAAFFTTPSTTANGPAFRVRASPLVNGDVLVIGTPISGIDNTLSRLLFVELLVTGGALVAAVLLGLWLVRVGLRPLRDVERTATAIADGELMHRVPNANTRTEVGHVASAFNVMLERIESLVTDLRTSEGHLRRFVGDASHELRTPIAAISAYAQLFKKGAAARQEDLERVMSGIERESGRMGRLVEDLLTLAKLDERRPLERESVELVGLVLEAAETARTVGDGWPLSVVASEAVEVLGDRGTLRQVVDNLLANVRAHTPAGTNTTITVSRDSDEAIIEVADDGPGITEEQARLVFERFFRADPSRSRATGGAGLGLAIVASIIEAHGGRVIARPRPEGGATFRVTLPALDQGLRS